MRHLYNRSDFASLPTLDLDPRLHLLLSQRIAALEEELIDWTEYLVVEPGDTEADIQRHIGLSPLVDPVSGKRWGEEGFHPGWDYHAKHDGWWELLFTFGSTFAYVVFIADAEGVPGDLLDLCRRLP
ncbi:hypothetical protein HZF05_14575 [Sphingomonas sp. CGMCC 1.13654]|uniref:Uncharacterized protein n=1 Tax=Sphingomonas chungangi TaxID=2683589 RepID=A0A838L8S0_9SPHN|nr:hypothetical protein [Sphingomonas chungangi]MBA2935310.1 hypothetical protein [Sphingomonas chungangi]MVW56817.1 hypothetical protein [Sphingomonas chungangi]